VGENGAFGFDPDDFDRVIREGSEDCATCSSGSAGLSDLLGSVRDWLVGIFEDLSRRPRSGPEPLASRRRGVGHLHGGHRRRRPSPIQVRKCEPSTRRVAAQRTQNNVDPKRQVGSCRTALRSACSATRSRIRFRYRSRRSRHSAVSHVGRRCRRRFGDLARCPSGM